jgi:hypothetical protein
MIHHRGEFMRRNGRREMAKGGFDGGARGHWGSIAEGCGWRWPSARLGIARRPRFSAEGCHQDGASNDSNQPTIAFNDAPKMENLKKMFPGEWRDKPVLVAEE